MGLWNQLTAHQERTSASHDGADFAWTVLLDREDLRAHYGEGFRTGLLTAPAREAAGQPEERAHGPAQQTSRTDYASFVRGRSDRTAVPGRSLRAPGPDPAPPNTGDGRRRTPARPGGRRGPANTQEG